MNGNFLLIDPTGNTILIPASNEYLKEVLKRIDTTNVIKHPDKRELWKYITDYMKGKQKMIIIKPSYQFLTPIDPRTIMKHLEQCGRVCYKSESKITDDSADKFLSAIIKRGHEAVLEHYSFTVKFIVDRGVSHEIVRHRLASYCQESTRYCNYSKEQFGTEITVIDPCFGAIGSEGYEIWKRDCEKAEASYFNLLNFGWSPEQARTVLPNSLKTELIMTANVREWRHFLKLRTSSAAHPQMREVTVPLLKELQSSLPILFSDIEVK